ncbi:MAG: carboxymuconolactone decarboxylase family protein [Candidatus Bruticola sp.]
MAAFMVGLCLAQTGNAVAGETSDSIERVETCSRNLSVLWQREWQPNSGSDAEFMDILQKYIFGEIFTVGRLDIKTREMLTVTSLSVQQTLPQLKSHITGALNAGVEPMSLREAIYQCAPFIGFPKTLNAIGVFNEVIKERGLTDKLEAAAVIGENNRFEQGVSVKYQLYGNEPEQDFADLPDDMGIQADKFFTAFCFGDIYTRRGLSLKQRELLSLAVFVTNGQTSSLRRHIQGAIKAGNTREEVVAAIIQCLPYVGLPNTLEALKVFKEMNLE